MYKGIKLRKYSIAVEGIPSDDRDILIWLKEKTRGYSGYYNDENEVFIVRHNFKWEEFEVEPQKVKFWTETFMEINSASNNYDDLKRSFPLKKKSVKDVKSQ